jgi:hypothetical protein
MTIDKEKVNGIVSKLRDKGYLVRTKEKSDGKTHIFTNPSVKINF